MTSVPNNWACYFQPTDLTVNKTAVKAFCTNKVKAGTQKK